MDEYKSATELNNLYSNNTYNIKKIETHIINAMQSSFNYLKGLQRSYINIHRFNFTQDDFFINRDGYISISLNKDFIEAGKRKNYKYSKFYTQYFTLQDIANNPDIFSFIPLVILDDGIITSFKIQASLDGNTTINFTHVKDMVTEYVSSHHTIKVVYLKNTYFHQFNLSATASLNCGLSFTNTVTGTKKDLKNGDIGFIAFRNTSKYTGTNLYPFTVNNSGNIVINEPSNIALTTYLNNNLGNLEITIISPRDIKKCSSDNVSIRKSIFQRIDNSEYSAIAVVEPAGFETYDMPLPPQNIFIFKVDKITGEYILENDKNVILHYPNIYEIISDDSTAEKYDYEVYYFYRKMQENLKYENLFKFIHRYFARKYNLSLEDSINKLIYTEFDEKTQNYFFSIFGYEDPKYIYDNGDFQATQYPDALNYKIDKLNTFGSYNPTPIKEHGIDVTIQEDRYFLYVQNINLENRIRNDSSGEAEAEYTELVFDEPCYAFAFRNDTEDELNLRIFIDGAFCNKYYHIHSGHMDYIYIPTTCITSKSYIEIEKFGSYQYYKDVIFTDTVTPVELDFTGIITATPTLYDLYVTDYNGTRVDRSLFKIVLLTDNGETDISDTVENAPRYSLIQKLKVTCMDSSLVDTYLTFNINKIPYLLNYTSETVGVPKIELFNGVVPWNTDMSYVRYFINRRMVPIKSTLIIESSNDVFIDPHTYLDSGDIISVDITPYSYKKIYEIERIPDNFIVCVDSNLPLPLDFRYYDIYLNGLKLNETNTEFISYNTLKLFNVASQYNLSIFQKERDKDIIRLNDVINCPINDFLNSDLISDEDKDKIVDYIIHDNHDDVTDGTDDEPDLYDRYVLDGESAQGAKFYIEVIIPRGKLQPNSFILSNSNIKTVYPDVYNMYVDQASRRLILHPNKKPTASKVLRLGKHQIKMYIKGKDDE